MEKLAGLNEKKKLITSNPSEESESYSESYGYEDPEKGSPSPKDQGEEGKLRQSKESQKNPAHVDGASEWLNDGVS